MDRLNRLFNAEPDTGAVTIPHGKEIIVLDTARLKAKIVLHGENHAILASALGITQQTFSAKINAKKGAEFTQSEIAAIKQRYHLTQEEIDQIFFN